MQRLDCLLSASCVSVLKASWRKVSQKYSGNLLETFRENSVKIANTMTTAAPLPVFPWQKKRKKSSAPRWIRKMRSRGITKRSPLGQNSSLSQLNLPTPQGVVIHRTRSGDKKTTDSSGIRTINLTTDSARIPENPWPLDFELKKCEREQLQDEEFKLQCSVKTLMKLIEDQFSVQQSLERTSLRMQFQERIDQAQESLDSKHQRLEKVREAIEVL